MSFSMSRSGLCCRRSFCGRFTMETLKLTTASVLHEKANLLQPTLSSTEFERFRLLLQTSEDIVRFGQSISL